MSGWAIFAGWYGGCTAMYSAMQLSENLRYGKDGELWAPVWWIALTWPFWLVMIAMDVPICWSWRNGPKRR